MTTVERINGLLASAGLPAILSRCAKRPNFHAILNSIDSAIGADTEWIMSNGCKCQWHIGNVCFNRRAIGARVRMLETIMMARAVKRRF